MATASSRPPRPRSSTDPRGRRCAIEMQQRCGDAATEHSACWRGAAAGQRLPHFERLSLLHSRCGTLRTVSARPEALLPLHSRESGGAARAAGAPGALGISPSCHCRTAQSCACSSRAKEAWAWALPAAAAAAARRLHARATQRRVAQPAWLSRCCSTTCHCTWLQNHTVSAWAFARPDQRRPEQPVAGAAAERQRQRRAPWATAHLLPMRQQMR